MFAPVKRATLLYPSPSANDPHRKHLFILLTDPFPPIDQVLMVSVCTIRDNRFDKTCILRPGEHDFIEHESYVAYAYSRIEPADKLSNGVKNGYFTDKGLLDQIIFDRVLHGLTKSQFTKPFAIEALKNSI